MINRTAQPKALWLVWFLRQIRQACATRPLDYTICDFQSGTKFVFSLHDTRMKFPTRRRISFAMKTGMTCTITKFRVEIM